MEPDDGLDVAVSTAFAKATPAELEELDAHLGRSWGPPPEARMGAGETLSSVFVLHRRTGAGSWFPVGTCTSDTSLPLDGGPSLLSGIDAAATAALGAMAEVRGLSVVEFFRVVEGNAGPGEISLADAHREAPDFVVGDELGRPDAEVTTRLRWTVLRELRTRNPLTIADDPAPAETVRAALEEEADELGQTVGELQSETVARVGVPLGTLDADTARLALDEALRSPLSLALEALVPLTPARAAALVEELAGDTAPVPENDATLVLSEWEQARFDSLQSMESGERRAALTTLASQRNVDPVWHVLAAHAQARPADLAHIEALLESWSDGARLMPHVWLSSIQAGRFAPHHRLVRQLVLEGPEAALLSVPGVEASLGGLRGLGLQRVARAALERVFALDWLGELRELHLIDTPTLAATDAFPRVERLQVQNGQHRAEDLADLIVSPSFSALRRLHLFGVGVGVGALARALGERPLGRAPFTLRLTSLPDAPGLGALAEAPAAVGLAGLELIGMAIDPGHATALAAAPLTLRHLVLHEGKLGPAGAEALASASWWSGLEHLALPSLSGCGDAGVVALLRPLAAARHLELRHQELGAATAALLSEAYSGTLEHLDLSHNPLDDEELARVLRNPTLRGLRYLSALRTGAGEATLAALAEGDFPALEVLELGDHVSDAAAARLRNAELPKLKRLQLRGASREAMERLQRDGLFATNAMFA